MLLRVDFTEGDPDFYTLALSVGTGRRANPEFILARLRGPDGTGGAVQRAAQSRVLRRDAGRDPAPAAVRRREGRVAGGAHASISRRIWGAGPSSARADRRAGGSGQQHAVLWRPVRAQAAAQSRARAASGAGDRRAADEGRVSVRGAARRNDRIPHSGRASQSLSRCCTGIVRDAVGRLAIHARSPRHFLRERAGARAGRTVAGSSGRRTRARNDQLVPGNGASCWGRGRARCTRRWRRIPTIRSSRPSRSPISIVTGCITACWRGSAAPRPTARRDRPAAGSGERRRRGGARAAADAAREVPLLPRPAARRGAHPHPRRLSPRTGAVYRQGIHHHRFRRRSGAATKRAPHQAVAAAGRGGNDRFVLPRFARRAVRRGARRDPHARVDGRAGAVVAILGAVGEHRVSGVVSGDAGGRAAAAAESRARAHDDPPVPGGPGAA